MKGRVPSRQQLVHDLAEHVGQPEVAALEAERQLRVVEAEQPQQRRVQVVDVDAVLGRVEAELVRRAQRAPRAAGPRGSCWRTTPCPAPPRTWPGPIPAPATGPSGPGRWPASGRPSRTS